MALGVAFRSTTPLRLGVQASVEGTQGALRRLYDMCGALPMLALELSS